MQALNITIFGIIALALDVGIVNVLCAFTSRFQLSRIRALRNSFGQEGHLTSLPPPPPPPSLSPKSEGSRTPIPLDHQSRIIHKSLYSCQLAMLSPGRQT